MAAFYILTIIIVMWFMYQYVYSAPLEKYAEPPSPDQVYIRRQDLTNHCDANTTMCMRIKDNSDIMGRTNLEKYLMC